MFQKLRLIPVLVIALAAFATTNAWGQGCASCQGNSCQGNNGQCSSGQRGCCLCCSRDSCPPPQRFCRERGPRIRWTSTCARPVCGPCEMQHYGYYQPCWRPWPFHPDTSHCSSHGPAPHGMGGMISHGQPPMALPLDSVSSGGYQQLPPPRYGNTVPITNGY